ncbi:diguanylate cyclase [Planctomycetota bacterium]
MHEFGGQTLPGAFYKALLDSLFDAVYTVDRRGVISYWNQSCERITGYTAADVLGQPLRDTCFTQEEKENHVGKQRRGIEIVLETGMPGTWKGYVRRKNGQRIPIESHISAIRDEGGEILGAVEVFRDTSAHQSLETAHRQLLQMSRKDQLTSLYNRSAVRELLEAEMDRSRRYEQSLSVVMMDIDHFKRVNDRYGHDAGDKVLSKVGAILAYNLRKPDIVGRWGGEEFLIVAPSSDKDMARQLSERMRNYIKEIAEGEIPTSITASFGVAQMNNDQSLDELLYVADMALYEAKRSGRDRVVVGKEQNLNRRGYSAVEGEEKSA